MYQEILNKQRVFYQTHSTKSYQTRLAALKKLKTTIVTHENAIKTALKADLGKSSAESYLTEIGIVLKELSLHLKKLKKWMKPVKKKSPLALFPAKSYLCPEPLGTVLIISPWNYPFLLTMAPLIGAITAGNTAIIKPSEISKNTEKVIVKIIAEAFAPEYVTTIQGDATITQELLKQRFDYIFFTGSTQVGKIVMEAASKHLTPVTLELGGKSPAIIAGKVDLDLAAKRILFGKVTNAGQTCIAPDYLLIKENDLQEFTKHYQKHLESFFGKTVLENENYPKIINEKHHRRLIDYLKDGKVVLGGEHTETKIAPTLLLIDDLNTGVMQEEIFGPILPIVTYQTLDEVYQLINGREKPLATYLFTNNKEIKRTFNNYVSSGGLVINDTIMHFVNENLGFGGVGNSGMGKYHGFESFKTFSHYKAVVDRKTWLDINLRYQPLTGKKEKIIKRIIK